MAMRSMVSRTPLVRLMEVTRQSPTSGIRYLSSGSGRILDEEERAAENIYIKKMEKEKLEKKKLKEEKEKAEKEKSDKMGSSGVIFHYLGKGLNLVLLLPRDRLLNALYINK
ncbi:hypothetical protein LguiB_035671 [Lonicera macranthoides]